MELGDLYCPGCGSRVESRPPQYRAEMGERLIAYAIDFIAVSAALTVIFITARLTLGLPLYPWSHHFQWGWAFGSLSTRSLVFFTYWTFTEYFFGQSLGKMVMGIRVADVAGGRLSLVQVAVESFGKSFILPFDLIAGIALYSGTWMRLTSYLSGAAVVRDSPECCPVETIII